MADLSQPANFDYLIALGITFARSGHENADAAVLQWLTNKPSEKRIDIASAFLCGLWDRRFRENPVPPDRIEKFIRELNTVTLNDDDAAYSSILALAEVMKSDSSTYIKEEVAAILRSAYKRQCKDKIQEEMLRSVIEEVLGNDG